jgi:hypothetical protein
MRSRQLCMAVLFAATLALNACQSTGGLTGDIGSGPITLSPKVKMALEQHKSSTAWGFLAVSTDGQNYGWGGCPSLGACYNDGSGAALRRCRQRSGGVPCKIYADGPRIVWRGVKGSGEKFKPTKAVPGSGTLTMTAYLKNRYEKYLAFDDPLSFAIAKDASESFGLYCSNTPCLGPGSHEATIARCEDRSAGVPCYLYAVGRKIVWKGPVTN